MATSGNGPATGGLPLVDDSTAGATAAEDPFVTASLAGAATAGGSFVVAETAGATATGDSFVAVTSAGVFVRLVVDGSTSGATALVPLTLVVDWSDDSTTVPEFVTGASFDGFFIDARVVT